MNSLKLWLLALPGSTSSCIYPLNDGWLKAAIFEKDISHQTHPTFQETGGVQEKIGGNFM